MCMIVFPIFFLKRGSAIGPIIMTSILVVGLNALYQVIYAMIPDCVEVDELVSGERREGIFYSMATVSQKIAAAIAINVLGQAVDRIGYNPILALQSTETLTGFRWIFIAGTSVCLMLSIVCMITNPLSKKRYNEVLKALEDKKAGKSVDINEFKDLLFMNK